MKRLATIALLLAAACGSPPPPPPGAVIVASPEAVCQGDGYATVITLDATRSTPRLTLVPAPPDPSEPPLSFTWTLEGAAYRIVSGDLHAPVLAVTTSGERPLHATLSATNAAGGEARATKSIAITVPPCAP